MRVHSVDFKRFKIKVVKVKRNKKDRETLLLFTVDRGVRVYKRYLENLGDGKFGMNYNGNFIEMDIKF